MNPNTLNISWECTHILKPMIIVEKYGKDFIIKLLIELNTGLKVLKDPINNYLYDVNTRKIIGSYDRTKNAVTPIRITRSKSFLNYEYTY